MKTGKLLTFAFAVAFVLSTAVHAGTPEREYKFGCATPDNHHLTNGLKKFSELLTKYTDGRIVSHVYVGGQLATGERELVEGLQVGTVDVAMANTGMMPTYDKRFQLFSLHYLFRDEQNAYNAVDGALGQEFAKITVEKANAVIIGWQMSGMHNMTNSKLPINSMADLQGLKLRCMESPMITACWKAYGAVPTPMSLGEAFTAMQQGTVDGQDNSTANTVANKYYEVQKYLAITEHMVSPGLLLMAKDKYDDIPADLKPAFDRAIKEAIQYQRDEYAVANAAATKELADRGLQVTHPDKAEFRAASKKVWEQFIAENGPEVAQWIDDIQNKY